MSMPEFKRDCLAEGHEMNRLFFRFVLKIKYDLTYKGKEYQLHNCRKVTINDLASVPKHTIQDSQTLIELKSVATDFVRYGLVVDEEEFFSLCKLGLTCVAIQPSSISQASSSSELGY